MEIKARIKDSRERFGTDWLVASQGNLGVIPQAINNAQMFSEVDKDAESVTQDTKDGSVAAKGNEDESCPQRSQECSPNMYDQNGNANGDASSSEDDLMIGESHFNTCNFSS